MILDKILNWYIKYEFQHKCSGRRMDRIVTFNKLIIICEYNWNISQHEITRDLNLQQSQYYTNSGEFSFEYIIHAEAGIDSRDWTTIITGHTRTMNCIHNTFFTVNLSLFSLSFPLPGLSFFYTFSSLIIFFALLYLTERHFYFKFPIPHRKK